MTHQQNTDFAPILEVFPDAELDDEGHPVIRTTITDAEADPVTVRFDADGIATLGTTHYAYLMLDPRALRTLSLMARAAQAVMQDWYATPSGKAWSAA